MASLVGGLEHPFTIWTDHRNLWASACSVCAHHKSSHLQPLVLLHPLPIPSRPWSQNALDFITGLPPPEGCTVILVVVDHFSKAGHFISLPKLCSTPEMARLMVSHVLRLHGLPLDMVSDQGSQFDARVWRSFCSQLGASVSLSLNFHLETNGQTEHTNEARETTLRCLPTASPTSWSRYLAWLNILTILCVCRHLRPK